MIDKTVIDLYNDDTYYSITKVNPLLINYFRENVDNKNAFDIGCGNGINSKYLLSKGYNVLSLDINEKAIILSKKLGLEVINIDIRNFNWNCKYDLVLLLYSLQHLKKIEAIEVIKKSIDNLKDNGFIALGIFTDRENCINQYDVKEIIIMANNLKIIIENEWSREDYEHGNLHLHKGYYCIIKKEISF